MKFNRYIFALILITSTYTINSMDATDSANSNSSISGSTGSNKRKRVTQSSLESKIEILQRRLELQKGDINKLGQENAALQNQLSDQTKSLAVLQEKQEYTDETLQMMCGVITDLTEYKKQNKPIPTVRSSQSDNS